MSSGPDTSSSGSSGPGRLTIDERLAVAVIVAGLATIPFTQFANPLVAGSDVAAMFAAYGYLRWRHWRRSR